MSGTSVVRLVDSITELGPQNAGCIAVSGSHGGASSARYAIAARPMLSVFNDAGVGKDQAGIEALKLLQAEGLAACAVAHDSARIGYAHSSLQEGIVSHANALALALGIQPGAPLREHGILRQPLAAPPAKQNAVVVGALGVIGRYIVDHLQQVGGWEVVGLSRRTQADREGVRYLSVDLLNAADCAAKLSELSGATHIFYAAFQAAPGAAAGYAANIAPNRDMLVNAVTAISRAAKSLRRVVLVTGTKTYGVHLGPYKTPAREDDPRPAVPNYYYDQVDWLRAFQRGKAWDWVELRPQTLCGFAPGTPMSLIPAIAVYAALCKARGEALRYPGTLAAYDSIYQVTESAHFARAALWAATEPRCAGQAFNITNGDFFRWRHVWPTLAGVFDMQVGEPAPQRLTETMADAGPLWDSLAREYALQPYSYQQIVAWPFADYVFNTEWDVMSDTTKARLHGFHDVVDTHEMMTRLLRRFRAERIVPYQ